MEGEEATPREGGLRCVCLEVRARGDEAEGLLTEARRAAPGAIIQVFCAGSPPNPSAVSLIAAQTITAAKSGLTLAERPELDILLRLAGTRQIGEAFRRWGYKSGGKRMFIVAASGGDGAGLRGFGRWVAGDKRFVEIPKRPLTKGDLEQVERAALLAARV